MGKTLDYRSANSLYFGICVSRKIPGNRVSAVNLTMPAIGHLKGQVLRLGKLIVAPDTARGRIKVDIAALQAKPHGSPDRTGREEPHRAEVVEAIEDTPRGIVV